MKAQELRIGNLVDLYGSVATIQRSDFREDVYGIAIDSGKPIPLTEEWLLKFGIPYNDWFKNTSYLIKKSNADFEDFKEWDFYIQTANKDKQVMITYIHYVHQLQNLFHALTGEELTIK